MAILGEVVIAGSTVDVVVAGAIVGFSVLACLYRLIDTLKDYPGQDEVNLRVISEGKVIKLKLSNMYANYCPELHQQLVGLVGEDGIKLEPTTP